VSFRKSGSLPTFTLENLAKVRGKYQISRHAQKGLCSKIHTTMPYDLTAILNTSTGRPGKGRGIRQGNSGARFKRSNRAISCGAEGILFPHVPGPKDQWKVETSHRPIGSECLHRYPHVLHGNRESIRASIIQGDWTVSIDLSDAYFHIPIHQYFRRF